MSLTQIILSFVEQHSDFAIAVVFLVAFLESMAIIGVFVPGWVLLIGVGTLIGSDSLNFYPIAIGAYLGAVIGEYLSFLLGLRYRHEILSWPLLARHRGIVDKSISFFEKHGVAGVFFGRFFGPTRAIVPLVAGVSAMPQRTFLLVNLISGVFWVPVYLIPGILIGAAANLGSEQSQQLLLILTLFTVVGFMLFKSLQLLISSKQNVKLDWLVFIKVITSFGILMFMLMIFIKSPSFELLTKIFMVLGEKLI